jgi:hypothetical protein
MLVPDLTARIARSKHHNGCLALPRGQQHAEPDPTPDPDALQQSPRVPSAPSLLNDTLQGLRAVAFIALPPERNC